MTAHIKQLEWHYNVFNGGEEWVTRPIGDILKYCILKDEKRADYLLYRGADIIGGEDNLQSAKDKIRADFEAKIKGCLS